MKSPPSLNVDSNLNQTSCQSDDDLSWDDICMNPYQDSLAEGMKDGHEAGLLTGFKDGEVLGRSKALEIGFEIGFYQGCASFLLDHYFPDQLQRCRHQNSKTNLVEHTDKKDSANMWTEEKVEKLMKGWKDLLNIISNFPSPDVIFHHDQLYSKSSSEEISLLSFNKVSENNLGQKELLSHSDTETISNNTTNVAEADITGSLQKIRSKFRVLAIKSKISKFSLKGLMDNVSLIGNRQKKDENEELNHGDAKNEKMNLKLEKEIIEHDW